MTFKQIEKTGQARQQLSLTQLLVPPYRDDPYTLYHQLRSQDPIYWDDGLHCWVLTSYDAVLSVLKDTTRFSAERSPFEYVMGPTKVQVEDGQVWQALSRQLLFIDPPDHTRLRRLVNKYFVPPALEKLRPFIQQVVDHLLDKVAERGTMEVIKDFAYPLPLTVITHLFGMPSKDRERFIVWDGNYGEALEGGLCTPARLNGAITGIEAFMDYFRQLINERLAEAQDDPVLALVRGHQRGDVWTEEELLGNCILILSAGFGTTTHLISNGLLALFQHPDQLEQWRSDPALTPTAVEEISRYDPTIQMTVRVAKEDIVLGDTMLRAGDALILCLGAANRDPQQFPNPDQLDLHRARNHHLTFGQGIHYCLGAHLARLEGQIAFSTLLQRFPHMRLAPCTLEHYPSIAFQMLRELPVILE